MRHSGPTERGLHISGDGPLRSEIEAVCQRRKVTDETPRVIFHGSYSLAQREAVLLEILRDANLLVFPTNMAGEGLPTVILEAMCAGVPVVATYYGGVSSFSVRYYPDLPTSIRLCSTETFMETVRCMIADIRGGRVDRVELREFYQRHFSDEHVELQWRGVLGRGRAGELLTP